MPIDDMIINFNQLRRARSALGPALLSNVLNVFSKWCPADHNYMCIDIMNNVSLVNDIDSDGRRYFSYKSLSSFIGADSSYWRKRCKK